jgi:hypothetical protein
MNPDIFFDALERTEWTDRHFAAIGRALALASRFDKGCSALARLLGLRCGGVGSPGTAEFQNLADTLRKRQLHQHVASIAKVLGSDAAVLSTLNEARKARNAVAHELALGFEQWGSLLHQHPPDHLLDALPAIVRPLAEGDRLVSLLLSVLTHEQLPSEAFLEQYPDALVEWVCDISV